MLIFKSYFERFTALVFVGTISALNCEVAISDVVSTFNDDNEGWIIVGDATGPNYLQANLPTGNICGTDTGRDGMYETWYFSAPSEYLGDISRAYGNDLTFRLKTSRYNPDGSAIDVLIRSGHETVSFPFLVQPGFSWTTYRVPLDPGSDWVFMDTEVAPTAAQLKSILASVDDIHIRADFGVNNGMASEEAWSDTGCLDDVVLRFQPLPTNNTDIQGDISGWAPVNNAELVDAQEDSVCAHDLGRDGIEEPWYWKAPVSFLGDLSKAYGKALTFRMKTTRYNPDGEKRDVLIHGGGTTISNSIWIQPSQFWTPYRVALDEKAGWVFFDSDQQPSAEQIKAILSSVTDILIRPDFGTHNNYADSYFWEDTSCFNNPVIEIDYRSTALESITSTFDSDNEEWAPIVNGSALQHEVAGIPLGHICGTDNHFWKAPNKFLGDVTATYGGRLDFDLKSTLPDSVGYVYLKGNGITLQGRIPGLDSEFKHFSMSLDTLEGWKLYGSEFDDLATESHIQQALMSLTDIMIEGYSSDSSSFTSCLDNVSLHINEPAITMQQAYIAYYGRPADVAGLDYWAGVLTANGGDLNAIVQAFGTSAEFQSRYGNLTYGQLVDITYQQLLNREPDEAGKMWWLSQLENGVVSPQSFTLSVLNGAKGDVDTATVNNKLNVAINYTARLRITQAPYDVDGIVSVMTGVSSDVATVETAKEAIANLL